MQKKVSIIVPCYNNGATILETLHSLDAQTHHDWEALFVDDGSSDETASIVEKYSAQDNRIRYIKRECEEKGGSVCRNIGLEHSIGEYVMFLDADDLLTPVCLQHRLNYMEGTDNEFAVFTTATFGTSGILNPSAFPTVINNNKEIYTYLYAGTQAVWHTSSTLFRRSFVVGIGGFDAHYKRLQDVEFHFRAIVESMGKYEVVREPYTSLYRVTETNEIKYQKFADSLLSYSMMSDKIEEYIENGLLQNDKKMSRAYLLLCTRYVRTISLLRHGGLIKEGKLNMEMSWMKASLLSSFHLFVLNIMKMFLGNPVICMRLCKTVDYLLRKSIVAR